MWLTDNVSACHYTHKVLLRAIYLINYEEFVYTSIIPSLCTAKNIIVKDCGWLIVECGSNNNGIDGAVSRRVVYSCPAIEFEE